MRRDGMAAGEATRWSPDGERWIGFLPVLGALVALVAYAFLIAFPSQTRPRVPLAAPLAAAAFALLQILLPRSRPSRKHLVSPGNWVLLAFFVQLVVMPLTISWSQPALGMLPHLPSPRGLDKSILISVAAFGAFSLGHAISAHRRSARSPVVVQFRPSAFFVLLYGAIGAVGLLLRFGSIPEMLSTLADPARLAATSSEQEGTLRGAASTFLRPFLLTSIVMTWCLWMDLRGAGARRAARVAATSSAVIAVVIVGATYGFNRAAFMVPLVAMVAAYSAHVRRLSLPVLAVIGVLLGALAVVPRQYRSGALTAAELARSRGAREEVFAAAGLGGELQTYASAPQFAGFLLEAAERSHERFTPATLLGSLMSPVPIVGKGFRRSSGPAVYNRLIYGSTEAADQIVPFEAEVYLCLGLAGLVGTFLIVGLVVGWLQRGFERAASAFDSYALQFTALWVAFLVQGSLAAVAQAFVYFFWPIYGYSLLHLRARADPSR